ncbi:hypothetical protein [Spirosoma flavus]
MKKVLIPVITLLDGSSLLRSEKAGKNGIHLNWPTAYSRESLVVSQ